MNNYIKDLLLARLDMVENKDEFIKQCHLMDQFGVNSDKDFKDYFYITNNIKSVSKNIFNKSLNNDSYLKVSSHIFNNRKLYPIDTVFKFYHAAEVSLNKSGISITKTAYPQGFDYHSYKAPHDLQKWKKAAYAIGFHINQGQNAEAAIQLVTKNWDKMERNDFKNWVKFYQEGGDKKYSQHKTAQNRFMELGQGAFLPIKNLGPGFTAQRDFNSSNDYRSPDEEFEILQKQNQQDQSVKQIQALIGRLNSAERLATTSGIEKALGAKYEHWLRALHDLKLEIQISMLKSKRSSLVPDMIIRKANQLLAAGHAEPARLMMKIAQITPPSVEDPAAAAPQAEAAETSPQNSPESQSDEAAPELASEDIDQRAFSPESLGNITDPLLGVEESDDDWVQDFLNGLSGETEGKDDDKNESNDFITISEDEIPGLKSFAQLGIQSGQAPAKDAPAINPNRQGIKTPGAPSIADGDATSRSLVGPGHIGDKAPPTPSAKPLAGPAVAPGLGEKITERVDQTVNNSAFDEALGRITIKDVVDKLEKLQTIFQTREISHQLSLADLALAKLKLSPFIPELGEAIAKSLDANQYCLTRVEDVISKLRGSDLAPDSVIDSFDLEGKDQSAESDQSKALVNKLKEDQQKDNERKINKEKAQVVKEDTVADALEESVPEAPQAPGISPAEQISQQPARIVPPTQPKA